MFPCRVCSKNAIWSWYTLGICDKCRANNPVFPLWKKVNEHKERALEIMGRLRASEHVSLIQVGDPLKNFKAKSILEQLKEYSSCTDHSLKWHTMLRNQQSSVVCKCGHGDQNHDRYTCQDVWCFCLLDRNSLNKEVNPLLIQPISN
jgi:hypothetical protein